MAGRDGRPETALLLSCGVRIAFVVQNSGELQHRYLFTNLLEIAIPRVASRLMGSHQIKKSRLSLDSGRIVKYSQHNGYAYAYGVGGRPGL